MNISTDWANLLAAWMKPVTTKPACVCFVTHVSSHKMACVTANQHSGSRRQKRTTRVMHLGYLCTSYGLDLCTKTYIGREQKFNSLDFYIPFRTV